MANTYTSLHYYFVFSTKNREPWITPDIEQRVWSFMGGIARENKIHPIQIGGIDDHIHLRLNANATHAPGKIAQLIQGGSSAWIHTTFPHMKSFKWQDGYGAFNVSKSSVPDVTQYIKNQREHHRMRSYQDEYLAFLMRHDVQFDEHFFRE